MAASLGKEDLLRWQSSLEARGKGDLEECYEMMCAMQDQPAAIVFNLSMMHCLAGNFDDALGLLTEAITKNKHLVIARFQRAFISHRLDRNEDALKDLQTALEMMHDAEFINYGTLGLEYVLCRHFISYNLGCIQLVLGLKEMSAEALKKAHETRAHMLADTHMKELAKDPLAVDLPELNDAAVEPCRMKHNYGACPLLKLPTDLIFVPSGLGKRIVKEAQGDKKDFLSHGKARVLFASNASHSYEPGFRGKMHTEEFMPMMIKTGKKTKGKKKPGKAMAGLISAAMPRYMMVDPTKGRSTSAGTAEMLKGNDSGKLSVEERKGRSMSLFVAPTYQEHDDSKPLIKDDLTIVIEQSKDDGGESSEGHEVSAAATATETWAKEQQVSTEGSKATDFLGVGMKKSSIGHARSVEVLYEPGSGHASDSDAGSYCHEDHDTGYDSSVHIDVQTQMTPTTLRDLADMLERLETQDRQKRFTINVHMYQGAPPV